MRQLLNGLLLSVTLNFVELTGEIVAFVYTCHVQSDMLREC